MVSDVQYSYFRIIPHSVFYRNAFLSKNLLDKLPKMFPNVDNKKLTSAHKALLQPGISKKNVKQVRL